MSALVSPTAATAAAAAASMDTGAPTPERVPALHWHMGLRYLELGWKLFVLPGYTRGKVPAALCDRCRTAPPGHDREACSCLLCHGFYAATEDTERLAAMWRALPGGVWGLRTGAPSGVVVLDAECEADEDGMSSGVEVLDAWDEWVPGVPLTPTLRARTRSGGVHLFYSTGADVHVRAVNRVLPGLDVKGNGGYAVLPPGVGGERRWLAHMDPAQREGAGACGGIADGGRIGHAVAPGAELLAWLRAVRGSGGRTRQRVYVPGVGSGVSAAGGGYAGGGGRNAQEFRELIENGVPRGMQDEILNEMIFRMVRLEGVSDAEEITRRTWIVVRAWDHDPSRPWTREHVERKAEHVLRTVPVGVKVPRVLPRLGNPEEVTVFRWDGDASVIAQQLGAGAGVLVPREPEGTAGGGGAAQEGSEGGSEPALREPDPVGQEPSEEDTGADTEADTEAATGEGDADATASVAEVIGVDFETGQRWAVDADGDEAEPGHGGGADGDDDAGDGEDGRDDDAGSGHVGYGGSIWDGEPGTEGMHDTGNANRLLRLHGHRMRWLADEGQWLVWGGHSWRRDRTLTVEGWTTDVMTDIAAYARQVSGEEAKQWTQHMRASYARGRRAAMEQIARTVPGVAITSDLLDADPGQMVVKNGVLDLSGRKLMKGRKEDLNTLCAGVEYRPQATCPAWRKHVETITCGDDKLARYLQRLAGYSLTGLTNEQAFFSLEGSGANGKNVFVETLVKVMGDYADIADSRMVASGDKSHAAILADLVGKRLVFIDEIASGRALDTERVKMLCGGAAMKAQFMAKNWFSFTPRVKLWIAGNAQPPIRDGSDGIWRRMHRVMFRAKIREDQRVKGYAEILYAEEGPGILNWCLEGLQDWITLGSLGMPEGVAEDVAILREDSDHVRRFIDECCEVTGRIRVMASNNLTVIEPGDYVANDELFKVYATWCSGQGITEKYRTDASGVARRLTEYGAVKYRDRRHGGARVRGVEGVRVLVDPVDLLLPRPRS